LKWHILAPTFDPKRIVWEEGTLLKDRYYRKVWLFEDFVVKGFRKKILQRDPARKEALLGMKLKGASPEVLAYGQEECWRYVVTKRIKGPDLKKFLRERYFLLSSKEKKIFWGNFVLFLEKIIKRGIFQPDFHLENILLEQGSFRFYLLDLHRAYHIIYNEKYLTRQLAYLLPPLLEVLSWWEIGRLTALLVKVFPFLKRRSFRREIKKRAYTLMRKHFSKREKVLKRDQASYPDNFPSPQVVFENTKFTKNSRVTKTGFFPPESPKFWIKAYRRQGLTKFGRKGRLEKSFWGAYCLQNRGIATILPLAYWREKGFQAPWEGFIVYPYLSEVKTDWRIQWLERPLEEKETLLKKLIRFIWEMHERGILHGDTKITNFALGKDKLIIFDLDAVCFLKNLPSKGKRLKDLATLASSLIWFEPEREEIICQKIFNFYAFLAGDLCEKDYLRFKRLVGKRFRKRLAKMRNA